MNCIFLQHLAYPHLQSLKMFRKVTPSYRRHYLLATSSVMQLAPSVDTSGTAHLPSDVKGQFRRNFQAGGCGVTFVEANIADLHTTALIWVVTAILLQLGGASSKMQGVVLQSWYKGHRHAVLQSWYKGHRHATPQHVECAKLSSAKQIIDTCSSGKQAARMATCGSAQQQTQVFCASYYQSCIS